MGKLLSMLYLATILSLNIDSLYAQSQNYLWLEKATGIGKDAGHAVAADAFGNCYVTGEFRESSTNPNEDDEQDESSVSESKA